MRVWHWEHVCKRLKAHGATGIIMHPRHRRRTGRRGCKGRDPKGKRAPPALGGAEPRKGSGALAPREVATVHAKTGNPHTLRTLLARSTEGDSKSGPQAARISGHPRASGNPSGTGIAEA